MLDPSHIRAITLDLDDTLWPVWPAIRHAEARLLEWLQQHAPSTAQVFASPEALRQLREQVGAERQDLQHNLTALRQETIRRALRQAGDDENLTIAAFDIFFAARHEVQLFDDALPALEFLAARWPIVAITNGNADVHRIGIGHFFQDSFNVMRTGYTKPDPRIFAQAVDCLQLPASAVLHVGDDAQLDAVGAHNAGLRAVWLNRSGADWPVPTHQPPVTVSSLQLLCDWLSA